MVQMHDDVVEVVRPERAGRAALLPVGAEHEVVDDELALAREEIGERLLSLRAIEDVLLLDFFPRKLATLAAQRITLAREGLLQHEKFPARFHPFVVGDGTMRAHSFASYSRLSFACVVQKGRGSTPFRRSARMPTCASQPPATPTIVLRSTMRRWVMTSRTSLPRVSSSNVTSDSGPAGPKV